MSSTSQKASIPCKVEGCADQGKRIRGYCSRHYAYWWRHGVPTVPEHPIEVLPVGKPEAMWLAAVLDCEGWIGTTCAKRGEKRVYTFGIGVGTTTPELTDRCLELTRSGKVMKRTPKNPRARDQWHWNVWRIREVHKILRTVEPYLIVKREQARLVLACPKRWSPAPTERQQLHESLKALNARGRAA